MSITRNVKSISFLIPEINMELNESSQLPRFPTPILTFRSLNRGPFFYGIKKWRVTIRKKILESCTHEMRRLSNKVHHDDKFVAHKAQAAYLITCLNSELNLKRQNGRYFIVTIFQTVKKQVSYGEDKLCQMTTFVPHTPRYLPPEIVNTILDFLFGTKDTSKFLFPIKI